jgi:GTP-binding protein EngB required for normal cell division
VAVVVVGRHSSNIGKTSLVASLITTNCCPLNLSRVALPV